MTRQQAQQRLRQLTHEPMLWPDTLAEAQRLAAQYQITFLISRTYLDTGKVALIDLSTGAIQEAQTV